MFRYVSDISEMAHYIIKNFCCNFDVALDATLGNGHDTDFLSAHFNKIYSFDIQKECIDRYSLKTNSRVQLIHDSHEYIDKYVKEDIDCIMFNLGFLPGGDKKVTTKFESTIVSLEKSISLLNNNGIITVAMYCGHEEGALERDNILEYVSRLPKNLYGVMHHKYLNRTNNPPELIVIEKK